MAIRKLKHVETAEDRMLADRVTRARKSQPPRDPTGEHHATCADIARAAGRDVADVLDVWDERAAARQYEAGIDRTEAERLAIDDVRSIYQPKGTP